MAAGPAGPARPARDSAARRVRRAYDRARPEIRQEFLVMHDAAPGAETEFQPASGGVMIGTGPPRCAPVEPGAEVRIGTIAARRKDDSAAANRLSARLQAAVDAVLDGQAVAIAAQFPRTPA